MKNEKTIACAEKAPQSLSPKEGQKKVADDSPDQNTPALFPSDFYGNQQRRREYEQHLRNLLGKGEYERYLLFFGGHERFEPFLNICRQMPDADYWKCLALVWDNIEISFPDRHKWLALFESTRPGRSHLMSEGDWKTLAGLPDTFTVFRGYAKGRLRSGLSWTLSEERARIFAAYATGVRRADLCGHKQGGTPMLVFGRCRKEDVLAYFDDQRGEEEIVIRPENVFAKRSREIQRQEPK